MPLKTAYPNGQSKQHYVQYLILKYRKLYGQFSKEQIIIPISNIVVLLSTAIESNKTAENIMAEISFLEKFVHDEDFLPKEKLETYPHYMHIYCFNKGKKGASLLALMRSKIPFPDQNEEAYLHFTKNMTREVILGITTATKDLMNELERKELKEDVKVPQNKVHIRRVRFFPDDQQSVTFSKVDPIPKKGSVESVH